MKSKRRINYWLILGTFMLLNLNMVGQDSLRKTLSLGLQYFDKDNSALFLMANAKAKTGGRFNPIAGLSIKVYLDIETQAQLMDSASTDERGLAKLFLPERLKEIWQGSDDHTFIATSSENDTLKAGNTELMISKSRIIIDTASVDRVKSISVTAQKLIKKEWLPIKGLEMKLGLKRLGGLLKITEEDTYTTDSTGKVVAEIKDTSMLGDSLGSVFLVAQVEENDTYGNLSSSLQVPWGKATVASTGFFDQRTLWSTRFKTPYWLLLLVYGMSIGIWAAIISVIRALIKTIRLGK